VPLQVSHNPADATPLRDVAMFLCSLHFRVAASRRVEGQRLMWQVKMEEC